MNIQQVLYFLDAADTHSLHKSAERNNISTQGFSKALRTLEIELGVNLVERSQKGVFLTEEGTALYKYFKDIADIYENINDYCNDVKKIVAPKNIKGDIFLVITTRFADSFFNTLINKFKNLYPKVNFYLEVSDNMHVVTNVQNKDSSMTLGIISIVNTEKFRLFDFEEYCRLNDLEVIFIYEKPLYFCGIKKNILNMSQRTIKGDDGYLETTVVGYKYGAIGETYTRYQLNSITAQKNMIDYQGALGTFTLDEFKIHFNDKKYAYRAPDYKLVLKYAYVVHKKHELTVAERAFLQFLQEYFLEK